MVTPLARANDDSQGNTSSKTIGKNIKIVTPNSQTNLRLRRVASPCSPPSIHPIIPTSVCRLPCIAASIRAQHFLRLPSLSTSLHHQVALPRLSQGKYGGRPSLARTSGTRPLPFLLGNTPENAANVSSIHQVRLRPFDDVCAGYLSWGPTWACNSSPSMTLELVRRFGSFFRLSGTYHTASKEMGVVYKLSFLVMVWHDRSP